MILDFRNKDEVTRSALQRLTAEDLSEWESEIYKFIIWYFEETTPLTQLTSGSTGKPKEILLSRSTLEASARATIHFFELQERSSALLCIPAKYIGGKMMVLRAILGQWSLTCVEPKSHLFSENKKVADFDFAAMVPIQAQYLAEHSPTTLKHLKHIIIGGAAVSNQLEHTLISANVNAYSSYGMTETASHVALRKLDGKSGYNALNGISFSVDADQRLIITGERVPNSPLNTTDVVELMSAKSFHWLGRSDHVINSGGVKIITEELEKLIENYISRAFFIRKSKHKVYGETPVLVIEGKPWDESEVKEQLALLKSKLPIHWPPTDIQFQTKFDWTETGKIKR